MSAIARAEAEFYGAMDGAAKFNQRDSLATILITAINIVAGLAIGVLQQGTDLMTAVKTYTILTVGDGLVTMIPSLLVTIAGGLVLTRASSSGQLDDELRTQLFARRNTLADCMRGTVDHGLVPAMLKLAFLLTAVAVGMMARRVRDEIPAEDSAAVAATKAKSTEGAGSTRGDDLAGLMKMDELSLEMRVPTYLVG